MAGSIRELQGRGPNVWELRVFIGRDSTGRVQHRSRVFRGSRKAAERELARMVVAQQDRPVVVPDEAARPWGLNTTFNDAISGWQENGWQDLSPLTAARYESVWRLHIKDGIGKRKIAGVGPYDLERYFRQLKRDGAGHETVRYVRSVLHRACRLARKWSGNELPNPVADTELPLYKASERPEPVRAPSVDEVAAILRAASSLDPRYAVGLRIVAATGMRRGEVCALRWSDVDLSSASVLVDEAVIPAAGGAVVKSPKTRASVRRVAIDSDTAAAIAELKDTQRSLATFAGVSFEERDGFVLSVSPGGREPLHPDTLSKAFAKARRSAGVAADVHLHSLRHFQATALDAVISERQKQSRLGWSTAHMARHYTDAVPEDDVRAAEHIGGLLNSALQRQQ